MRIKRFLKIITGKGEEAMIEGILETYQLIKKQNPDWNEDMICKLVMCECFKLNFKLKNNDEPLDYVDKILKNHKNNKLDINTACYLIITTSLNNEYNILTNPFEKRERLKEKIKELSKEFKKEKFNKK